MPELIEDVSHFLDVFLVGDACEERREQLQERFLQNSLKTKEELEEIKITQLARWFSVHENEC